MRGALLAMVSIAVGCGGSGSFAPPALASDPGYPSGPYGYLAGGFRRQPDVLPDLLFAGKRVPVGQPASAIAAEMISVGSLRSDGVRYFVIETSGAWCSDCVGDQPAMMQLESDYAPKGVLGFEILLEGALDAAATIGDVDQWSRDHGVSGLLLVDAARAFEHAAGIIAFPTYFIVDAATMQIVTRSNDPLAATPLGPELDSLLSQ